MHYNNMNLNQEISQIIYLESNLNFLQQKPQYINCSIQILCIRGKGIIHTGAQQYSLQPMRELIFWNGSIMQLQEASTDFFVRVIMYPQKRFLQAAISLDHCYFKYMLEFPLYDYQKENNIEGWQNTNLWMNMAQMLFTKKSSCFREKLEINYLQSMLMWIFSSIPSCAIMPEQKFTRKKLLFHKFIHLVHVHAVHEHQVNFYSEKLCISSRYLHEITALYSNGKSPKEIIEEQLTAEIMVLLNNPCLSIAQIAELCKFSDASYLNRFFKKNTGIAPGKYRNQQGKY